MTKKTKMPRTLLDAPGYRVDDDGKVTPMTRAEVDATIARIFNEAIKKLRVTTLH
jgi:hypothetical protein